MRIELALEELSMLGLYLEKKPNPSLLMYHEKPKYRSRMPPVKKSYMSVMECVMECREHLSSDEDSLFIGSIDGNFESDEGRGRQEEEGKELNLLHCTYFLWKIQLYISPFSLYSRACKLCHLQHQNSISRAIQHSLIDERSLLRRYTYYLVYDFIMSLSAR